MSLRVGDASKWPPSRVFTAGHNGPGRAIFEFILHLHLHWSVALRCVATNIDGAARLINQDLYVSERRFTIYNATNAIKNGRS